MRRKTVDVQKEGKIRDSLIYHLSFWFQFVSEDQLWPVLQDSLKNSHLLFKLFLVGFCNFQLENGNNTEIGSKMS